MQKFMRGNLKIMVEAAVMIALATVLSEIQFARLPFGGSVTLFSMVPIMLIALRHGAAWGLICAFVYSNTQLILGLGHLTWVPTISGKIFCVLFDFTLAFSFLGIAGFFKCSIDKQTAKSSKIFIISAAVICVCLLRYISHVISAIIVWRGLLEIPEDIFTYLAGTALGYNAAYMIPETIISLAAVPAIITVLSALKARKTA